MSSQIPEILVADVLHQPHRYGLQRILSCTPVVGGVVHHVWELCTAEGRFFLKIRGTEFCQLPIASEPGHIAFEARATCLLADRMPEHFPRVVCCLEDLGLLIVSDVIQGGATLERLLLTEGATTQAILTQLGVTLRAVHEATASLRSPIRPDDMAFFEAKLDHKLRFAGEPVLDRIIKDLLRQEQLIIGDPSPKNIGVQTLHGGRHRLTFFDLEDVHMGSVAYDYGSLIGHLLLHSYSDSRTAAAYVAWFHDGYGRHGLDVRLTRAIALGTLLYRLDSIVPYCVQLPERDKRRLSLSVRKALASTELGSVGWERWIQSILEGFSGLAL